jgi:twitching motility protein PilT
VADKSSAVRERAVDVLARRAPATSVDALITNLPNVGYATQQVVIEALTKAAASSGAELVDRLLPLMASGDASTRTAVMKILIAAGDPRSVIRRYISFVKGLPPFVHERTLEALRAFGPGLVEPVIELLTDPDEDIRAAAMAVASSFQDPRIVPATIALLRDPDWWIRISAADSLGRTKDPRAVDALIGALADPELKWSAVEALGRIADPRALNPLGKMLGDPMPDVRIEVMQALRQFDHPQVVQALTHVASNDPERTVRARAVDLLDDISLTHRETKGQVDAIRERALSVRAQQGDPRLHALLIATRNRHASDFHLAVGQPPVIRLAADLVRIEAEPFTAEQTEAMLKEILTEQQWATLEKTKQLDFCYYIPQGGRYRGNVFLDHKGYSAVFRVIPEKPPTIFELGLPAQLADIADYHQGIVLICGPSGSGKSTTLAALVNLFNETRSDHVITMEDPVEFVHPFKNCLINQREVGKHTESFARALRAALREDPDVIVIGELRDNDSVSLALTAAETGHIVLGTLNATSAPKAIDRVISNFPFQDQPQIRASLSESLKYVISQRLLPSKQPHKLVAAFEVLKGTSTIANLIRDEKTYQIFSAMQIGRSQGMQTFDEALKDLVKRDQITPETAYMAATKKEDFEAMVSAEFLSSTKI